MQRVLSNWRMVVAASVLVAAAGPAAFHANADQWNKRTVLTVNQPIQVEDTVLQPGQYVLMLLNSNANRHLVEIYNSDQSHLINTVSAVPAQRTQLTGSTQFTYWETPAGTAKALRDWFYPGDTFGQEFTRPKHNEALAMLVKPEVTPEPAPPAAAPAPQPAPQPVPAEPTTPEASASEVTPPPPTPPSAEAPPETDQTPASDQAPAPAATPAPPQDTSQPAELPKTGSRYPLLGITGVVFLGIAGLLRLKRPSLQ